MRQQDIALARGFLSEEFRANTDEDGLQAYFSKSGSSSVEEASWSERKFENRRGELSGYITTESGGNLRVKLALVKGAGV